jgi:hypothetical protein
MYELARRGQLGFTLPKWLTPPAWLTNEIKAHIGAAVKGTTVSIPTDSGTITFDISDPTQWAAIAKMLQGIRINPPPPVGSENRAPGPVASVVNSIPGGWLTIGIGGFLLYKALSRRG